MILALEIILTFLACCLIVRGIYAIRTDLIVLRIVWEERKEKKDAKS